MKEIEKIKEYLKENLSDKRYNHSLGVANEAVCLAKRYGVDIHKAYIAGLVHDCAKEINPSKSVELLKGKYGVFPDEYMIAVPRLLHGLLGAHIAYSEFKIDDEDIFDAIRYHTTGKANMGNLTKIIYIADYIEPGRAYPDVNKLREITYRDIDEGILFSLDYTICDLVKKGISIHPDTVFCRNFLIKKVKRGK